MAPWVKSSGIYNPTRHERIDFENNLPDVAFLVIAVVGSTGSDGSITIKPISPDGTVTALDVDVDEAGAWSDTNNPAGTDIVIGSLAAGEHVIQVRDYGGGTPGNTSKKHYVNVPDLS